MFDIYYKWCCIARKLAILFDNYLFITQPLRRALTPDNLKPVYGLVKCPQ